MERQRPKRCRRGRACRRAGLAASRRHHARARCLWARGSFGDQDRGTSGPSITQETKSQGTDLRRQPRAVAGTSGKLLSEGRGLYCGAHHDFAAVPVRQNALSLCAEITAVGNRHRHIGERNPLPARGLDVPDPQIDESCSHGLPPEIGIGGASRLLPSHTTVRTGPYTAVRSIMRLERRRGKRGGGFCGSRRLKARWRARGCC